MAVAAHKADAGAHKNKQHDAVNQVSEEVQLQSAWQKVFDRFDIDASGMLDVAEVREALKIMLGAEVPAANFGLAMRKFDSDRSGSIDIEEFGMLVHDLRVARKKYVEPPVIVHPSSILGKGKKLPCQDLVLKIYNNRCVAFFVALCIIGNFVVNIMEKQIDPDTKNMKYEKFWSTADITFNIIFIIELWANMWGYGGPTREFWRSGWNVFDTIIVIVGILTMAEILGPPLDKLKLMRAFRVFRLFKRVESLNKIIVALLNSVPGVLNAFFVMFIFFCIYAILAVELFREFGEGGAYIVFDSTTGTNFTIDAISPRGYVHGIEYYGTFMRALYTLFQVMTGESWSEAVARPLIFGLYKNSAWTVGIFFVSFIILVQMVLINVVVAVLLDKFVTDEPDDNENAALETRLAHLDNKEASDDMSQKLDTILERLSKMDALDAAVNELNVKIAKVEALSHSVADLKGEMYAIREQRTKADDINGLAAVQPGARACCLTPEISDKSSTQRNLAL
jgi:hypothetical protein